MSELPIHGKSRKKSLYVFVGIFTVMMFVSVYFVPQYLPIPINQQTILLFLIFSLFIASIGIGYHHKKLKTAHTPMIAGLILLIIGGSLVYGSVHPDAQWWVLPPEQIGMFALLTILGGIIFSYGVAQSWKKTNL